MKPSIIINFVLFQIGWFACVLGAAWNKPWLGTFTVAGIIAFHLYRATEANREIWLLVIAMTLGFFWDSLMVITGLLNYQSGMFHPVFAPHWIIAMWALFATTFNVSMSWLKGHFVMSSLFGAVGGPLAYYGGMKLGAVTMPSTLQALVALSIGWAILMPLLMKLAVHFDGFDNTKKYSPNSLEVYDV